MPRKTIEILLVEDNPAEARLMADALKNSRQSCHVTISASGADALDFLFHRGAHWEAPIPDLVLLDLTMPGKSGHEVLREVKSRPDTRLIPVMILTSSDAEGDVQQAYGSHANCYVKKPTGLDDLTRMVKALEAFWFEAATLPGHPA